MSNTPIINPGQCCFLLYEKNRIISLIAKSGNGSLIHFISPCRIYSIPCICNRPAAPLPAKAHDTAENIQHIQGRGRETSDGEPIPPQEGGEILQRNEEAPAGECKAEREHEEVEIRNRRKSRWARNCGPGNSLTP